VDETVSCLAALNEALKQRGDVVPGGITHAIEQLKFAFEQEAMNITASLEQHFKTFVPSPGGGGIAVDRFVDVVTQRVIQGVVTDIHTELKTGTAGGIGAQIDLKQLEQDAGLAIQRAFQSKGQPEIANVTKFAGFNVADEGTQAVLQQRIGELRDRLFEQGFSEQQVRRAIASLNFADNVGNAVRSVLNEKGEVIFKPAMEELFAPQGPVAQSAKKASEGSPDFTPAMEVLFGPSGKVARAATGAVEGTNLTTAQQDLEQKLEKGVNAALDEAGQKAAAHAGESLATKIGAGATALGNVFTSVPMFYDSITKLDEAWHAPLKSTKDYMNLFSAVGQTITQGTQVFQALAGVTQIATAAQALFNAVLALNPIVLVVIAVIALIAGIVLLIVYWDQVKAALRDNPWLAVIAVLFGVIGIIVLVIAYWDEIKLAVLKAANFISIQVQMIGQFFVGLKNLAGQVWDWIVATVMNAGISIVNTFITIGSEIQNFFIGIINAILGMYNKVATSAVGQLAGLKTAELIPKVDVQTRLIPPREVPKIDVEAAFKPAVPITGGLEGAIAKQQDVIAKKQAEEAERKQKEQAQAAAPAPGAPAPALPGGPSLGVPALPPAGALPALPEGGPVQPVVPGVAAAAPAPASVDQSVHVQGITININAERLEADAGKLLSDEIIRQLQARLGALRSEQDFRTGVRAPAPA